MQRKPYLVLVISIIVLAFGVSAIARAQGSNPNQVDIPSGKFEVAGSSGIIGTGFTYQGQLKDAGGPVSDNCDFQFSLWETLAGNEQVGATLEQTNVPVTEGLFTVLLNFTGPAFDGNNRWLGIAVRCPVNSGEYNTLAPRQMLTTAPFASFSLQSGVADKLDGLDANVFQHHYQNLVVVAKSGGDFTTITDALNNIATNSASNPFTIYVAPGVYTETVTMKPYVDIEGAGEQATKITFTNTGSYVTGTVVGTNNAELRFLTVESTGGSAVAYAIYNSCGSSLRITHVTAIASGGWNYTSGVVTACGSSPTLINVTAIAFGASNNTIGVDSYYSSPTMTNVTASASGGTKNYGVYNDLSSSRMTNVTATASGGTNNNYGVYNEQSSPSMTNVIATASGGTYSYGVFNDTSSPSMTGITASASGGSNNYGMWNLSSSLTIQNSVISASGGTNDGLHNVATSGSYTVKINNSQISASTSTIYQDSHYTTQVGASQLAGGGAFGTGTYVCVASYNGSYTALDSTTCR